MANQIQPSSPNEIYEIVPQLPEGLSSTQGILPRPLIISKKRILVGSSQVCDLVIPFEGLSAIHAIIEWDKNSGRIYDMNSQAGVFINGEKKLSSPLSPGDIITLGTWKIEIKKLTLDTLPPPPLSGLTLPPTSPQIPSKAVAKGPLPKAHPSPPQLPDVPKEVVKEDKDLRPIYPLARDPQADSTEYIFEDAQNLYQIFATPSVAQSVEVIILFHQNILSVDYYPVKKGEYFLAGKKKKSNQIEYPHLGKNEVLPFIQVHSSGEVWVDCPTGHQALILSSPDQAKSDNQSPICLGPEDIIQAKSGDKQLFIRLSETPPKTITPPILRRDKEFRLILYSVLALIMAFLVLINLFEVDEEKREEKNIERIATILYKPKLHQHLQKKAPPKVGQPKKQQKKKKVVVPKTPKKQLSKAQPRPKAPKKVAKTPPKQAPAPTQPKKRPPRAQQSPPPAKAASSKTLKPNPVRAKGPVRTWKSTRFKSTINSLLAKGGSVASVKRSGLTGESKIVSNQLKGGSGRVQKAKVDSVSGPIKGTHRGALSSATDVSSLATEMGKFSLSVPSQTVVMGSIDPNIIRRILREHLPQFRYCYQRKLDQSRNKIEGVINLNFIIGASGHVSRAGVKKAQGLPGDVRGCVINVLRGIKFPPPLGGGQVEIHQPLNFYAQ